MELREAIEEIIKVTLEGDPWSASDFSDGDQEEVVHVDSAIATILNAVFDGTLTPIDAVFQVREGYRVSSRLGAYMDVPLSEALEIRSADDVRREAILEVINYLAMKTGASQAVLLAIRALIDTPQPKGDDDER